MREIATRPRHGHRRRRARDRARSRAGQPRQEHDHAEERRGRESRFRRRSSSARRPAIMVNLDGEPIWSPIKENDLKFAVNTNWDLFQHATARRTYLRNDEGLAEGGRREGSLDAGRRRCPDSFKKLPADDNWKDVKDSLPGKTIKASAVPTVFVSQTPGELILLTGEPAYKAGRPARSCMWVSNTESDVFRMGTTGLVYYLVAGRWFSAPDFKGPWTFATPSLPDDFKKIPRRARSLARARVGAGHRSGDRSGAARADSADRARQQEGSQGARRRIPGRTAVPADRPDDRASAPSTPTRTSSRSTASTTCATRASGSSARARQRPVGSRRNRSAGDLQDPGRARRRTTSPT